MKNIITLIMASACMATASAMEMKAAYDEASGAFRGSAGIGEWTLKSTLGETTAEPGKVTQGNDGILTVERRIKGTEGQQCLVRETFTPDEGVPQSGKSKSRLRAICHGRHPFRARWLIRRSPPHGSGARGMLRRILKTRLRIRYGHRRWFPRFTPMAHPAS